MSLNEPRHSRPNNHVRLLIDRLYSSRPRATSFMALCDRTSIPRDLRSILLQRLVSEKYVTAEGGDTISLTKKGTALAVSPVIPLG